MKKQNLNTRNIIKITKGAVETQAMSLYKYILKSIEANYDFDQKHFKCLLKQRVRCSERFTNWFDEEAKSKCLKFTFVITDTVKTYKNTNKRDSRQIIILIESILSVYWTNEIDALNKLWTDLMKKQTLNTLNDY